LITAIKMSKFW